MKGKKIFFSLCSFSLTLLFLVSVFTPTAFSALKAQAASKGLKENISSISDFFDFFKNSKTADENNLSENAENNTRKYVYAAGTPIGIKLYCNGVIVVGTDDIETENGKVNPAKKAGLLKGDVIKSINGEEIKTNRSVTKFIEENGGNEMTFEIERNGVKHTLKFCSVKDINGGFKAGLWIRDSSAGIGTLSFVTEDGRFASLGHGVCDIDTGSVLPIGEGTTTNATITGVFKGVEGSAGELCGELSPEATGVIFSNDSTGIYGKLYSFDSEKMKKYPVAKKSEVKKGSAQIIATVEEGETAYYDIEITDLSPNSTDNKNLVVKVTDASLTEKTGGIVQGMSGSPIIQNGMLVGAVTHVFINDPKGGYGVYAETMLKAAESIEEKPQQN